jgi:SAM-dependent methyltransferase
MEYKEKGQARSAYYVKMLLGMLQDQGVEIPSTCRILDFGCGEGQAVYALRKRGLQAFGADVVRRYDTVQQRLSEEGLLPGDQAVFGTIDMTNYRIPFEDNAFDVVLSWQVFEHVQNWPQALAEIKRVLKPGGASLHVFPARYRPIEGHVFVPLASLIQARPYLSLWAYLGVRNSFQQGMNWKEVARKNEEYLKNYTIYLSQSQIRRYVVAEFGAIRFLEKSYLRHNPAHLGHVYLLARIIPFAPWLVRVFHMNVVFFRKPPGDCWEL